MTHEQPKLPDNDPVWAEARALEASIRAIRRAQGKRNPEDYAPDDPECIAAMEEFVRDVGRVLTLYAREAARGDDSDLYGAGATG
ncbi:hypothetical protein B0G62_108232 [Paraburkholderia eburnea]|uniref:Uncharacterized protein n=1 Tax=Paraburkholderia eburnea TaxID=1189126 RepID=A0A2S4M7N3_9BURK|nr:hypothetical protein [Paraburkholderia eburnea]POR50740.1 hypothetical protein B0G62_108232 [Paraburkholderia eburnea]PRZ21508.1 hypothetical protein BX588_109232 [Paraburkholderia eburnea]